MSMPPPINAPTQSVPNHLAWAIVSAVLATCLCCPIGLIGIVAIVYAAQVNTKLNQGDIEGARRASDTAKIWCWVATALAAIGILINIWMFATGGPEAYQEWLQQIQQQAAQQGG
jgi:hypothetical protein